MLTILGEYVLPRGKAVWQETLVRALVSVGYTQQAARQALARSVRDGWLETERHGRRARLSLSERTAELLHTGAERIYAFGEPWNWDGRWLVLILRVPEERREVRHHLRTRVAWAGLGSLGGGVWLTPHTEREAELAAAIREEPAAEATSFTAELGSMGGPADVAAAAWDLDRVREHYDAFIDDFGEVRPSGDEALFRMQTLLVHAWRKFPFLDPDLPAELLPSGWPRQRAHDLFAGHHSRWHDTAQAYFGELDAGRSPRASEAAYMGSKTLTESGGTVELLDLPGSTPALLLLHEGLGSVGLWRGFPQQLHAATGRRTIAYSRYGHGRSAPPPKRRTATFMHEEALGVLPELLRSLRIEDPVLVGHSDGASIALIYAAHHRPRGVVAIAPHVFVEDVTLREIERARTSYLEGDLRERMARHHRDPDAAFYGWSDVWLDPAFPEWRITGVIEHIQCPLLLIQGTRDQYGTMAQLDEIEQRATGPVRRLHLECEHSPQSECQDETVNAIVSFISELNGDLRVVEEPLDGPDAQALVADYVAEIRSMYPEWTPDVPPGMTARDVEPPAGRWLVAYLASRPVGCAGLKRLDERAAEIKRLYVAPEARGAGVARGLIKRLEVVARDAGYDVIRLDTGAKQPASVALFSSSGYEPIADYNGNPVAAYWFEKRLA